LGSERGATLLGSFRPDASVEATVMELAQPFEMSQPAISRHLKVLEGASLIVRRAEGTRRHCSLAPAAFEELEQWLAMLRRILEANYSRLDRLLATMSLENECSKTENKV
jgi:DNA-binding transcriptional ArsR family regulator